MNIHVYHRYYFYTAVLQHHFVFIIIEVKALLLSDILVLLHNQEDTDKVILKQYHIEPIGVGEVREEISPIIRVKEMILRHYATDKGKIIILIIINNGVNYFD